MMRTQEELRQVEARCTEEQPPACSAGCPLGVDVRAFLLEMGAQRFARAWKILEKSMPLPGVVVRLCEAPCEGYCVRGKSDSPLAVSALEKVCLREGENPARIRPLPGRKKKVCCLGSGPSSLVCAWDLAKKGYQVEVVHLADGIGGPLLEHSLPQGVLEKELAKLRGLKVSFCRFSRLELKRVEQEADALFLGRESLSEEQEAEICASLLPDGDGACHDPITMQTADPKLFTCGKGGPTPFITAVSDGRQAAISIDRWLQNASLTSARVLLRHGKTRLSPDLSALVATPLVEPQGERYSVEEAAKEAGRCINCHCLRCVNACTYLQEYGNFPRVHARNIFNNFSIYQGVHDAYSLIDSCSLCGQCEELCPSGFSMAALCLDARRRLVAAGDIPPSAHYFALQEMESARTETFLLRHAPGEKNSRRLFYPGCQLAAIRPQQTWQLYHYLLELDGQTGIWLDCCGAPAFWAGRQERTAAIDTRFLEHWQAMGRPEIITACSSCLQRFAELDGVNARSVWGLLAKQPPKEMAARPEALALSDPCSARHDTATRQAVRTLLEKCGQRLAPLAASGAVTECCGFGGLMENANTRLAEKVVAARISQTDQPFLTYCAMCRDRLARGGGSVYHLLDLLFPMCREEADAPFVTLSARRYHRAQLTNRFLTECFSEEPMEEMPWSKIALTMNKETELQLDERRILHGDLRQTLYDCEQHGRYFTHKDGRRRTMAKLGEVFFWVEYRPGEHGYHILRGWSHRMVPGNQEEV